LRASFEEINLHTPTYSVDVGDRDIEDLTDEVRSRGEEVREWIDEAQEIVALPDPPAIEVGEQCTKPFLCGFCAHRHEGVEIEEDPFAMLPRLSGKKKATFKSEGIEQLCDVPPESLNEQQITVRTAHLSGKTLFDSGKAKELLGDHRGSTYFLDFETVMFAIPIWKGSRPFQNLPFQYSLHRVDSDGSLDHTEFLNLDGDDPREALARQMIKDCGTEGPIYAYNAGFERGVIKQLAELYPTLAGDLEALNGRIDDLLPIARNCYYNPSQMGSWSLKAVAPAISGEISYDELDGVQVGSDAGVAYLEACSPETSDERREELRNQMLKYCEVDTLATVRIWELFKGISKDQSQHVENRVRPTGQLGF